jgi:TonB family protein
MTENVRLYVLISLGIHLSLLILLALMKAPRVSEIVPRRVVIEFSQSPQRELPSFAPEQARLPDLKPQELADSLKMEGPKTLAMPGMKSAEEAPRSKLTPGGERLSYETLEEPLLPRPISPAAAPILPKSLLAEELMSAPEAGPTEPVPAEEGELTEASGYTEDGGFTEAGALEWRGRERKVLKTAGVSFPDILLEEGLEVDVVAVFTVAANGQVVEVDILRSSGYATVDTAVQRALYSYLFEPSADSSEDVGKVQYRFRLERGD